ncbi:MAG TPA: tail fiber domain-containing protein [Chthoniobacterales bacterium]|jgi:hypothetical protein
MKVTSRLRLFTILACTFLVVSPQVFAVDPPPVGGYPGENTATGDDALFSLSGSGAGMDTAIGYQALYNTTTGGDNIAVGAQALYSNTTGSGNVAIGDLSLYNNTTGTWNVVVGQQVLGANATGSGSVGIGFSVLSLSTSGMQNTAVGFEAMSMTTTASYNTALGADALSFDSSGTKNTALGRGAMNMATGSNNVAVGYASGNTLTGDNNIVIGYNGGFNLTKGANNIEIGNQGVKNDANVIRIGDIKTQKKTFIAGISDATVSNGVAVMVNAQGQLGVATSSARFKDDIKPMKDVSDVLLSLQPVTFRYKRELDSLGTPQFGLVAEQVAKVDPDLVARRLRPALHRALRSGERDVAQRISQGASHGGNAGREGRAAGSDGARAERADRESERGAGRGASFCSIGLG